MMSIDPILVKFVILAFVSLLIALVLRLFKQPSVVSYIMTGIILGPFGFNLITDYDLISHLGNLGVILLLFFVGMEISLKNLVAKWKIAIFGTFLQILFSVGVIFILGYILKWNIGRIILIGFVISLSSTAVVLKILETRKESKSKTGNDVLTILIVQDIAVVGMVIIISLLSGGEINFVELSLQIVGIILALFLIIYILKEGTISIPFLKRISNDHELQTLAGFTICFGIAILSGLFHLSTAFGAFIGGIVIAATKETHWIHNSLKDFKVIFLALFFVSIGMLIDLRFLWQNKILIFIILIMVYLTNTFINAFIFRLNGRSWKESFYGGSILSQIGEFSFILGAIGMQTGLITNFAYQVVIEVIALSLIISPIWISFFRRFLDKSEKIIKAF